MTSVGGWLGRAGEVTSRRILKDARPYEFLFPRSKGENITIKRNAGVKNTVKFIPEVVNQTTDQTEKIASALIAPTLEKTCEKIWQWVYDHIRYEKDEDGKEQVRSPARMFWDRRGDCDCFTTFIDSVLVNVRRMKKWPMKIINRITKYDGKPNFQHIYPMVELPGGQRIVMDCVTEYFDYEEPYSAKEDHEVMDLEYLNGIDSKDLCGEYFDEEEQNGKPVEGYSVGELGKLKILQRKGDKKSGSAIKKAVHAVNRVNPATLALRNGLLLSMKLNVMNVAGRLKWTYLTEDEAKKKGLNMERFAKAKKVREKLEKIFYGAGGMQENLREAILTGKGNKGKNTMNGLGLIPIYAMSKEGIGLREIIGADLFDRENAGLSGLGVVTEVTLAAATAAVATLSELLKQIGPLKDGQDNSDNPDASSETVTPTDTPPSDGSTDPSGSGTDDSGGDGSGDKGDSPEFLKDPIGWTKANPGKAVIATVAVAALVYGGYQLFKGKDENEGERSPRQSSPSQSSRKTREEIQHVPLAD